MKKIKWQGKKVKAFTLQDMLIALVIIGILTAVALANLLPMVTKAKTTEAKLQLEHLSTLEKSCFYEKSKYSTDLNEIGFVQEKLTTEGKDGKANYKISIVSASNTGFLARATAVADFDGDGTFNVWEIDQDKTLKEVTPD